MNFGEKVEELFQDVLRARDTYEAWWNLKNTTVLPKYEETMDAYSEYFGVAIHSHFVAMLLALFRLFDDHQQALSLPRIIVSLQSQPQIPSGLKQKLATQLAAAQPLITKIRLLRDKVFAHRDRAYSYERAFSEAGLTADEVAALIDTAGDMVNDLLHTEGKGTLTFERRTERDLLRVLADLDKLRSRKDGA